MGDSGRQREEAREKGNSEQKKEATREECEVADGPGTKNHHDMLLLGIGLFDLQIGLWEILSISSFALLIYFTN